ncbi:sugar diacid recognition domain-containing protein [Testudinibacter aquarius]|uniref:Carbohydrate diacid regulator n=1 Tax=Testudinibacter aquarius TaxID=1524974 RepID=A0A4R3YBF9_9PAST|nr:sugar diacid recognition domain-containing protein [Testudinibacter aquarius]KAE9529906.1 hypothetical protein A1D24_08065 [Testudinibacter aquarius]TCV89367.1 carbohydrate diacid regulator [Testudinibacter aquarius]TNG93178.1 hypothetical protein FHQ21_02365 [Testudinibacter aquarius]
MKLDKTIAQQIVNRTMKIIAKSVNVMDENGIIIASGDPSRLQQRHTGAVLALREKRTIEIDALLAKQWNYEAQPGINLPIHYLGHTFGVVGISGVPDEVRRYAELVKMTAELIVEQNVLLEQERWQRRYKEEFLLQLIQGKADAQAVKQAALFALDANRPYVVVIIKLLKSSMESLRELVGYLELSRLDLHLAVSALDEIVILQSAESAACGTHVLSAQLLPSSINPQQLKVAFGCPMSGLDGIAVSYRTALSTLNYGCRIAPKKQTYRYQEYKLPALLDGLSDWQLVEISRVLQPLYATDEKRVLYKTLQTYFLSNCDPARSAKKLFIHSNTLRYRLSKIEQLTQLSFNKIDEKFILYLATLLKT